MASLIYAPEVTIRIETAPTSRGKGKTIDVSDDISSGSVTRILNGVSTSQFTLINQGRKYDGMFTPMDKVVIYMRRIKTVLKFSGYLDAVPKWSALPASISLTASCSLKRLQNFYWDPTSPASVALLNPSFGPAGLDGGFSQMQDGGLAQRAIEVLTKVANWPEGQIHIARIPEDWYDKVSKIAEELIAESEAAAMSETLGSGAWIGGDNPLISQSATVQGIGRGTGHLPASTGRISHFGGPGGGAYGNMGLTGESGVNPRDPWYCAMRWPYTIDGAVAGAKDWWVNRRILVVNPKNGKAVILRAADWGPAAYTGRVIDVSPQAEKALGASTNDTVNIAFAPDGANLGPVSRSSAALGGALNNTAVGEPLPSANQPITSGWGAPGDERNIVSARGGGVSFQCHRLAKSKFEGFLNDLVSIYGYRPGVVGGYNDRNIANTSRKSNHAWGAAIDVDPQRNPYYSSGSGGAYALPHGGAMVKLARKWGLGWGGEWNNSKDYMHFEVIGAPASDTYGGVSGGSGAVVIQKWKVPIHGPYTISARFGEKGPHWANGHSGTDFSCPTGTPVYPVGPGKVHQNVTGDASYGTAIAIDHGGGNYTYYAHFSAGAGLSVGTQVTTETVIGYVGESGNVTGAHVHVEYRRGANTYAAALASGGIEKYILGGSNRLDPPAGAQTVEGDYSQYAPGADVAITGEGLFNVFRYHQAQLSQGGILLGGHRALLNDQPLMGTVAELMTAGVRDYCSAPNGDFIAWFPDHFGHYKQAGKMVISPLEVSGVTGPPTVGWSDLNLKTHQFVTSATYPLADDADTILRQVTTAGIASIEFPELMRALLNISLKEAEEIRDTYLERYGARPNYTPMNNISGARQEFFFACMKFMENWTEQYQASVSLMFMPELYPGMLMCLPMYGIQGYVRSTTDSFDMTDGGTFTTSVSAAPWSAIGRSDAPEAQGLPVGAPL
jgi:murein DD-endopeptidase MepM/ murein hydrolase activator NlpD